MHINKAVLTYVTMITLVVYNLHNTSIANGYSIGTELVNVITCECAWFQLYVYY